MPVGISRIVSFWLDGEVTTTWSRVCMSYFDDGHLLRFFLKLNMSASLLKPGSRLSGPMHYECRLSEHQRREKNSDLRCKRVRGAQMINNGPEESLVVRGL